MPRQLNEKTIFLFDGCGAALSTISLGLVLPAIQPWIGMPLQALYLLALIPVFYGIYSLACYRLADPHKPIWLQGIMVANLLYCVLTTMLLLLYWRELTPLGVAWFVVDALVIVGVVLLEYSVLKRTTGGGPVRPSQ